jgi:hypothetical protein
MLIKMLVMAFKHMIRWHQSQTSDHWFISLFAYMFKEFSTAYTHKKTWQDILVALVA